MHKVVFIQATGRHFCSEVLAAGKRSVVLSCYPICKCCLLSPCMFATCPLHAGRLHYVAGCGMDVRLLALNTDALPHLCVSVVSRFASAVCCLLSPCMFATVPLHAGRLDYVAGCGIGSWCGSDLNHWLNLCVMLSSRLKWFPLPKVGIVPCKSHVT